MASNLVQIGNESEIKQRLEAERARLRKMAGLDQGKHFHRPVERSFTAEDRGRITILFGGLTWKHEKVIQSVFHGCGYKCEVLPVPNVSGFQLGKEYGNNGQCNPTYFTVGNLVQYLKYLESRANRAGDHRSTTSSSPPAPAVPAASACMRPNIASRCRTPALAASACCCSSRTTESRQPPVKPGLKFTVDFGMGMLNAMNFGDVMNEMIYRIRPV
jgi:hypothetical protein